MVSAAILADTIFILTGFDMPKNSKVGRCVLTLTKSGKSKQSAIRICQSSTGQSYKTGRKSKKRRR